MKCNRCNNTDISFFYNSNNSYYCRKCIAFGRIDVGEYPKQKTYRQIIKDCSSPAFHFSLTPYQKNACDKMLHSLHNNRDVFVYAATGAGKTEIATMAIYDYLKQHKKVGFAISRRQVVLEIQERLQSYFPALDVVAVCEGYVDQIDGDIIVCTMHQLYRYTNTFDLLIMDEMDAFPYRGNEVLESIAMYSCKGQKVYLSATPDASILQDVQEGKIDLVELFCRPHGKPLVVPKIYKMPNIIQYIYLYFYIKKKVKEKIPILIFVPTIQISNTLYSIFKYRFKCSSFTSKSLHKEETMKRLKERRYDFLITTTILERGITIKGVDVIVLQADHIVFHEASLVQIAGRVGRDMEISSGEVLFLCKQKKNNIKHCISIIERMNNQ